MDGCSGYYCLHAGNSYQLRPAEEQRGIYYETNVRSLHRNSVKSWRACSLQMEDCTRPPHSSLLTSSLSSSLHSSLPPSSSYLPSFLLPSLLPFLPSFFPFSFCPSFSLTGRIHSEHYSVKFGSVIEDRLFILLIFRDENHVPCWMVVRMKWYWKQNIWHSVVGVLWNAENGKSASWVRSRIFVVGSV